MVMLKTGDPCPCCGQPIETKDGETLYLLSWIAYIGYLPYADEIEAVRTRYKALKRGGENIV